MRKIIICGIVVLAVVAGIICFPKQEVEHYSVSAKSVSFSTLEEMEAYSDIIVRAERLEEETPVVKYDQGEVYSGYTFSKVVIKEIYHSAIDTLEVGQEIRILENEFYDQKNDIVYHVGGYNMMKTGNDYLLFMTRHTDESDYYYVASGVNFGTISLEEDHRSTVYTTRIGEVVDSFKVIEPIWQDAVEKYVK